MIKKRCEECRKKQNRLWKYKNIYYCYSCYGKKTKRLNFVPYLFGEPISKTINFYIPLTKNQQILLNERVKNLSMKPSAYLRLLILQDLFR